MINVIGLGYIGLPTALMLAANGAEVVGTDCEKELVEKLNSASVSFEEKGLGDLFSAAAEKGIRFTCEYQSADTYIVAVPTPYDKVSKKIDSRYIVVAIEEILRICPKSAVIVIESTVSPGTIDRFIRPVVEETKKNIRLVHAPERIAPGNMIHELEHNSRTIGADDKETGDKIKALYQTFCKGEIVVTDIRTAEMTKVVENAFRDISIAYANELAKICRSDNMDVYEIIRIANKHPRVNILSPGPGVGGHCISVDPWFLVGDYPGLANMILTARNINDSMPEFVLERIHEIMGERNISSVERVGLYGLTYKENVDDVRESPTLQMLECMKKHLSSGIKVYDPRIRYDIVDNQYHDFDVFLEDVDMVVIMVGHKELLDNMNKLSEKIVFDTRRVCEIKGTYYM